MTIQYAEENSESISSCLSAVEEMLRKANFTVAELITLYANLGYRIGSNIATQFYDRTLSEPPNIDELQKLYYSHPTPDVALALNALTMLSWIENLQKQK